MKQKITPHLCDVIVCATAGFPPPARPPITDGGSVLTVTSQLPRPQKTTEPILLCGRQRACQEGQRTQVCVQTFECAQISSPDHRPETEFFTKIKRKGAHTSNEE